MNTHDVTRLYESASSCYALKEGQTMNAGDIMELTATTVCPQVDEQAAHDIVPYDPAVHIRGGVKIYSGDVLRLVRQIDCRHWLCRLSTATLVCLSLRHLKPTEARLT